MSKVPGGTAKHAIITDNCRDVQGGDLAAFDEAVARLRREYEQLIPVWTRGMGAQFHVVLSLEKPLREGQG